MENLYNLSSLYGTIINFSSSVASIDEIISNTIVSPISTISVDNIVTDVENGSFTPAISNRGDIIRSITPTSTGNKVITKPLISNDNTIIIEEIAGAGIDEVAINMRVTANPPPSTPIISLISISTAVSVPAGVSIGGQFFSNQPVKLDVEISSFTSLLSSPGILKIPPGTWRMDVRVVINSTSILQDKFLTLRVRDATNDVNYFLDTFISHPPWNLLRVLLSNECVVLKGFVTLPKDSNAREVSVFVDNNNGSSSLKIIEVDIEVKELFI